MVGGFKAAVTKRINEHRGTPGAPVWHADSGRHTIYESRGNLGADNRRHGAPVAGALSAILEGGQKIDIIRRDEGSHSQFVAEATTEVPRWTKRETPATNLTPVS